MYRFFGGEHFHFDFIIQIWNHDMYLLSFMVLLYPLVKFYGFLHLALHIAVKVDS